jgi:hypothetical protein
VRSRRSQIPTATGTSPTISYDLNAPGKNYQALYDALKALGATRGLLSEWVVRSYNTSAVALRDHVWAFMDGNDRLFVKCLDNENWASMNLMMDPNAL